MKQNKPIIFLLYHLVSEVIKTPINLDPVWIVPVESNSYSREGLTPVLT